MKGVTKAIDYLAKFDRRLVNMLATLPQPRFNPLREFLSVRKQNYPYVQEDWRVRDFLPGSDEP